MLGDTFPYVQRHHEKIFKHTLNTPITTETRVASEAAENPAVLNIRITKNIIKIRQTEIKE